MNAGPDVERSISDWLAEEAPARAPDRILDAASERIHRTGQRRLAVGWREPMVISMPRLVAAALILIAAVVGAGFIGRATVDRGPASASSPSPSPSPSPSAPSAAEALAAFRLAHDASCARYEAQAEPLKAQFAQLYDPGMSAEARASAVQALTQDLALSKAMATELGALTPPQALVADQAASVARLEDLNLLIGQILASLERGDLAHAEAVDLATNALAPAGDAFDAKWGLAACP